MPLLSKGKGNATPRGKLQRNNATEFLAPNIEVAPIGRQAPNNNFQINPIGVGA